ncbi:MAG: hypothetical protein IPK82_27215 [Polyangiaceae bacterium]|nr:hypothetical protein [Polyangiaceae bacterium]
MRNTLVSGLLLPLTLLACDPPPAKAPNPTRTLDERRAIEVIRKAVGSEGVRPAAGRDEKLTQSGKMIRVDVSIEGKNTGLCTSPTKTNRRLEA